MQLLTANGYKLMECVSALQKCIRRGLEEEALFWAAEIETRFSNYLWVRLVAIVNEDIGIADPRALMLVESLRQQYFFLQEKSRGFSERMVLSNVILTMCRAEKTRLGDDFQSVVYRRREFENWRLDVPDFALDQHTRRGHQLKRGWDHWEKEGLQLSNEAPGLNTYREESMRLRKEYGKMAKKEKNGRAKGKDNELELWESEF